jgi:hypothetical protein
MKGADLQQRNVLKKYERVALALKKSEGENLDVFKLPKFKRKRLKGLKKEVKKEEVTKEEVGEEKE